MAKKPLFPWYKVLVQIFQSLPLIMPKNFMRVTAGKSCGLRNIEELEEIGQSYEETK